MNWIKTNQWKQPIVALSNHIKLCYQQKKRVQDLKIYPAKRKMPIPTLFLHGTKGSDWSLKGMIRRIEKMRLGYQALKIVVKKDGKLQFFGSWNDQSLKGVPLIQVVFKDNNAKEELQVKWLQKVLIALKNEFSVTSLNIVGHSCGGTTTLRYLVDYSQEKQVPAVNKFVAIGAPFNGESITDFNQAKKCKKRYETQAYCHYKNYRDNLPKTLEILNIYGQVSKSHFNDGIVPVASVKALSKIVKNRIKSYQERVVTGWRSQHSLLHENQQVDQLVTEFLFSYNHI